MIEIKDKAKCNGCHACVNVCPTDCIGMVRDSEGFLYPKADSDKCVECKKCEEVCPVLNRRYENPASRQEGFAAFALDETLRLQSSSGGIFSLLCEAVLDMGGTVFGAAMTPDFKEVRHISVNNKEELALLRGSKYLQSTVGSCFKEAKELLLSGKPVLFSGTPCQIGGLYAYLGTDFDKLYTVDIICHGVPSPMVWDKYTDFLKSERKAEISDVFFRSKQSGWKTYSLSVGFSDGTRYLKKFREDLFMKGFLADIYLRPSCYECGFKTRLRQSDVTLADFWGIQDIMPELDDDRGASFVWLHSEKGEKLFFSAEGKMNYKELDAEAAIRRNSASIKAAQIPPERAGFFSAVKTSPVDKSILKYTAEPAGMRIKKKLSRIKHRLIK